MNHDYLENLLKGISAGTVSVADGLQSLKHFPAEPIEDACIDHQRLLRTGIPEVIYGESKSSDQVISIARAMLAKPGPLLATRISDEKAALICTELPELTHHRQARMLTGPAPAINRETVRGDIFIICAGTSDLAVAEEARVTATTLGHPVQTIYDAGVAGLHRLLSKQDLFSTASVIIVAAGMEGALPSVVGGLVSCPVIGVPTSVGYGAGIGGFAALLGMLNSCSPGVAVVNIDNGFGAACMAAAINRNR